MTVVPAPEPDLATVLGQIDRSRGVFNWRSFSIQAVDNNPVSHGFMSDPRDTVVKVAAGERRFVIQAAFNTGFGHGGPWETILLLVARVEAGKSYRITGEPRDHLLVVWLEDASTGEKVSAEAHAPYRRMAVDGGAPIFIPVPRR